MTPRWNVYQDWSQIYNLMGHIITKFLEHKSPFQFSEMDMEICHDFFLDVFDVYLRKTSSSYPYIFHNSETKNLKSIKKEGLVNKRNYFATYDNELFEYAADIPGISCVVDYREVRHRLFMDPEWAPLMDIIMKTRNPESFDNRNIDDRIISCLWVTDILGLYPVPDLSYGDIPPDTLKRIYDEGMFFWFYVKGTIDPTLITIRKHPDI